MSWFLKDFNYTNEAFAYGVDCFTDKEIKEIEDFASKSIRKGAGLVENDGNTSGIRECYVAWIEPNNETGNLFNKMAELLLELNNKFFRYDLVELEDLQYTEYSENTNGFYTAHSDDGYKFNLFRKLSISVQLSDPSEYEGGDLIFYRTGLRTPQIAPKEKGTIIVFPSYVIHEVTPVTKGLRKSLVSWAQGPRFK